MQLSGAFERRFDYHTLQGANNHDVDVNVSHAHSFVSLLSQFQPLSQWQSRRMTLLRTASCRRQFLGAATDFLWSARRRHQQCVGEPSMPR